MTQFILISSVHSSTYRRKHIHTLSLLIFRFALIEPQFGGSAKHTWRNCGCAQVYNLNFSFLLTSSGNHFLWFCLTFLYFLVSFLPFLFLILCRFLPSLGNTFFWESGSNLWKCVRLSMSMTSIMCRCRLPVFASPAVFPTRDPTLLSSATETKEMHITIHTLTLFPLLYRIYCASLAMIWAQVRLLSSRSLSLKTKPILILLHFSFLPASQPLPLCPSPSITLSVLLYKMAEQLLFFPVMLSQLHCYWSHFPSSLLSHFICHSPSLLSFSLLPPSSLFATTPQSDPFTSCPLPSLLLSMFSFFLQLHPFHPAVFSSLFPSFDHHSLHHCSLLILLSLSNSHPVFLLLFLPP